MNDFLFRVDDGPGVGAGHLMRCLALAEEICQSGRKVHLLATRPSVLHHRWRAIGADVMIRDCRIGSENDLAFTLQAASQVRAGWVIVDGYGFTVDWLDAVGGEQKTLCLDDVGVRDPSVALVLNHNPSAERRYAGSYRRSAQALLGLNWFLLRNEFKYQIRSPERNQILVCLGGEDPDNWTLRVMQALLVNIASEVLVDVVCNAPPAAMAAVFELAAISRGRFQVHQGPLALATFLARAQVLICGGGVTPVEALALGTVPVILTLAENQVPGSYQLAAANVARIAPADDDGIVAAARMAQVLLDDDHARCAMVASGREMVDGKGAERVAQIMMGETQ